jgi:rhomboid protease GluP
LLRERGTIPAPVVSRLGRVAGTFVVYNILFGLSQPMIDNAAHVGGLLGGAAAGAWLARPLVMPRPSSALRLLIALVVAGAAAGVAVAKLPKPPDFEGTLARFDDAQHRVGEAYRQLLARDREKALSDVDFAASLERDVLAPWREARRVLKKPTVWAPKQRELIERVDRYAAAKEHAFDLIGRHIHSQDPADLAAVNAANAESKRLGDEVTKGD